MIMIFPDPGVGPVLHYSTHHDHVELTCEVEDVFPQPSLGLWWNREGQEENITEIRSKKITRNIFGILYSRSEKLC